MNASSGVVNKKFWQTIYKESGGSGGPYITGWVVTLFPYVGYSQEFIKPNRFLQTWQSRAYGGVQTVDFPPGSVCTPFIWQYLEEEFDMYFYAGFHGVGQDKKTLALKPVIGWAVVDKEEEEKSKMEQKV